MNLETSKRTPEAKAAFSALIVGIVTHAFALVNPIHNYDNILQNPRGVGAGVTSGRWMLDMASDFTTQFLDLNYNLPLVNGLAFLVLIALSSAVLMNVLKIRRSGSAILLGCCMATFPAVASTMAFRYTAIYYGFALLFSVLAAWVVHKPKVGMLLSAICMACAMGIYQAYAPFTIGLFVLMLLRQSLEQDAQLSKLIRQGFYYCAVLILGVLLYFAMVKLSLALYSTDEVVVLDSYLGINNMGKIDPERLPRLILKAFYYGAFFAIENYCGLAPSMIMKLLWVVLILVIVGMVCIIFWIRKIKPLNMAFCCLMGLFFPLAINFQIVMSPENMPYTIMVYSIVLVACAPLMLLEFMPEQPRCIGKLACALLIAISFYNGYYTNYNYNTLEYSNRQVENFMSGLITQIRMTEGFTPEKKWVFVGGFDDPMLYSIWNEDLAFGGFVNCDADGLLSADYSVNMWIHSYLGYETPYADEEEKETVMARSEVQQMPCWPSEGSIQVMDEYVVVKFQELAE